MSRIWWTSCWKESRAVTGGSAATAIGIGDLGAWATHRHIATAEKSTTTAQEWAARLASGPTRAIALTKQLVNASLESDRATAFAAEAAAQEINMTTADAQEGVASFKERRDPTYQGR